MGTSRPRYDIEKRAAAGFSPAYQLEWTTSLTLIWLLHSCEGGTEVSFAPHRVRGDVKERQVQNHCRRPVLDTGQGSFSPGLPQKKALARI